MTSVLVTGAAGLLGRGVVEHLADDFDVTALGRSRTTGLPNVTEHLVDLRDQAGLREIWRSARPDMVIHAAALTSIEACEKDPETARLMNDTVVGHIAELSAASGARLVHISTDAVFRGDSGPYRESDVPDPTSVYGATKLAGERRCLAAHPEALVARVNFFGWSASGTRSIAEFFFNAFNHDKHVDGFYDVEFASLYNRDLAEVLVQASQAGISGVRHIVSSDSMTKWEFGRHLATTFDFDPSLVRRASVDDAGLVRRNKQLALNGELIGAELERTMPTIDEGLVRMRRDYERGYVQRLRSRETVPEQTDGGI